MDLLAQAHLGKLRKSPRKDGLGGDIAPPHKTAEAPKDRRSPQGLDRGAGVGVVIHRLGYEGPGQSAPIVSLPPESLRWRRGHKVLDLDQLQNAD